MAIDDKDEERGRRKSSLLEDKQGKGDKKSLTPFWPWVKTCPVGQLDKSKVMARVFWATGDSTHSHTQCERMRREEEEKEEIVEVEEENWPTEEKKSNISKVPKELLGKHFIHLLKRQDKAFFTSGVPATWPQPRA